MNPLISDYLKKKYGENYEEDAQQKYDSELDSNNTANLFSNLGDVIGGKSVGSNNAYFQKQNELAKANTIGKIENERNKFVKDQGDSFELQEMADKNKTRESENDVNNPQAKSVRNQLLRLGVQVPEGMSLADMKRNFGDAKSLNEIKMKSQIDFNNQKQLREMEQGFKSKENQLSRQNDMEKIQAKMELQSLKKKDPKNLSSTDKARYDNALMVLKGIDEMGAALDGGSHTFSLIGDNPYTEAERRATEGYGRMQSGGAINKDEEARFQKTLPRPTDDKELQRKKLLSQRSEMISRLKTLGFTPEEAEYQPKEFNYGANPDELSKQKKIVDRQINQKTGQTRVVYEDGSAEIISGNVAGGR